MSLGRGLHALQRHQRRQRLREGHRREGGIHARVAAGRKRGPGTRTGANIGKCGVVPSWARQAGTAGSWRRRTCIRACSGNGHIDQSTSNNPGAKCGLSIVSEWRPRNGPLRHFLFASNISKSAERSSNLLAELTEIQKYWGTIVVP